MQCWCGQRALADIVELASTCVDCNVTDDVEWNVPGGSAAHTAAKLVPYAGVYKSKAALLEQYLPVSCCFSLYAV